MSIHLTDKEIDNYVSGLASLKNAKKASEHIESCAGCRAAAEALQSVLAVQSFGTDPGEHVRKAVLDEWHRVHNEFVISHKENRPRLIRLKAGIAFAAFVILLLISGNLIFNKVITSGSYPLTLENATGKVYLNDYIAVKNTELRSGDVINTGDNASVSVSVDGYSLFLGSSSYLEIVNNINGEELRFKLLKGSVISKSSGIINYSFQCGDYTVVPAGTEFLLTFSGNKFEAAVSKGGITVTGLKFRIEIPAGMQWSSYNPGLLKPADQKILLLLNSDLSAGWPLENVNAGIKSYNSGSKTEAYSTTGENDSLNDESGRNEDEKDVQENFRIKREIRDDINEMKREQRREKKKKGGD